MVLLLPMGSVGDNYLCPWCGRVGNGGYATYGVGYPICTEGLFSCLWFSLEDRDIGTMQEFRRYQLRAIFPGTYRHHRAIMVVLDALAAFLSSPPSARPGPPQTAAGSHSIDRHWTLTLDTGHWTLDTGQANAVDAGRWTQTTLTDAALGGARAFACTAPLRGSDEGIAGQANAVESQREERASSVQHV